MKTFYKKIDIPIYRSSIHICVFDNIKKANKALKLRGINADFVEGDFNAGAIVSMDFSEQNYGAVVVFTPDGMTHGTIAHETYHIVNALLKNIGIKRCNASEEAYSYLQEYLVEQITIIIKSKGIKIND